MRRAGRRSGRPGRSSRSRSESWPSRGPASAAETARTGEFHDRGQGHAVVRDVDVEARAGDRQLVQGVATQRLAVQALRVLDAEVMGLDAADVDDVDGLRAPRRRGRPADSRRRRPRARSASRGSRAGDRPCRRGGRSTGGWRRPVPAGRSCPFRRHATCPTRSPPGASSRRRSSACRRRCGTTAPSGRRRGTRRARPRHRRLGPAEPVRGRRRDWASPWRLAVGEAVGAAGVAPPHAPSMPTISPARMRQRIGTAAWRLVA